MAVDSRSGLFFDNVVKTFGGTHALRGVSMHVDRGEIVALLGENGAGKSTLIVTAQVALELCRGATI